MGYLDRFFHPPGWQEKTFTAKDGAVMRYGHAQPVGTAQGTVVITTGYADCIESCYDLMHEYLARGYSVWVMDWAGQGGSARQTSKAFGVAEHVAHLREFRHDVVGADPATAQGPVILSTHSLGGQVGLQYMQHHKDDFDAAVMAAPLVDFGLSAGARAVLSTIFRHAVGAGMRDAAIKGGRADIHRQSITARRKRRADEPVRIDLHRTFHMLARPLGADDPTFGLIDSLLESTAQMNNDIVLRGINAPVLLGLGGRDHIVNNEAIRRASQLIPGGRLIDIPESGHNMWSEREDLRTVWWAGIDTFLADLQASRAPRIAPPQKPPTP